MTKNIVIIGGGMIGSAIAYFLARHGDADRALVLEPDQDYASPPFRARRPRPERGR